MSAWSEQTLSGPIERTEIVLSHAVKAQLGGLVRCIWVTSYMTSMATTSSIGPG